MWRRGRADGGEIKQNPILFHPDPVNREEEDSSHMKEQEGTQKPKACVRKPVPAPQIWCHPECKYPSTQHCLASPLLCHVSELLYVWCWWLWSMDTHSHPKMVEALQEHSSVGLEQSVLHWDAPGEGKAAAGQYQQHRHTDHKDLFSHLQFYPLECLPPLLYCPKSGNTWPNNP